jgi:predicted Zn finger-like uncharacterized protein
MLLACPNCATTYEVKASVIGDNGRSLRCARCQNVWFATRAQELLVRPEPTIAADFSQATMTAAPQATSSGSAIAPAPGQTAEREPARPTEFMRDMQSPPLAPMTGQSPSGSFNVQGEDIETFARRQSKNAPQRKRGIRDQFGAPAIIAILGVVVAAMLAWRVNIVQRAPQLASFYASIGLPVNLRQLAFSDVKTTKEVRDGVPMLLVEGTITSASKFSLEVPRLRFSLRNRAGQEIYSWTTQVEPSILAPGDTMPFRSRLASPPAEGSDVAVRFFNKRDANEGAR